MLEEVSVNELKEVAEKIQDFIHPMSCSCSYCQLPILKLRLFEIGCSYSRLMFLKKRYEICEETNQAILPKWDAMIVKYSTKSELELVCLEEEFVGFSSRWLLQSFDVLMKLEKYEKARLFLERARKICEASLENPVHPLLQLIFVKEKTLQVLSDGSYREELARREKSHNLNFADFMKFRESVEKSKVTKVEKKVEKPGTSGLSNPIPIKSTKTAPKILNIGKFPENPEKTVKIVRRPIEKPIPKEPAKPEEKTVKITRKLKKTDFVMEAKTEPVEKVQEKVEAPKKTRTVREKAKKEAKPAEVEPKVSKRRTTRKVAEPELPQATKASRTNRKKTTI